MSYKPIFLELTNRRCVVIGGGAVAEREVESLLEVGAALTVISPGLTERLQAWWEGGRIDYVARGYQTGDLVGHDLAFVAADNGEISEAVFREGKERRVWVNAADDPAHCDFILPSILRRGPLVVAVATGGSSPALSRAVREELETYFTEDYTILAEIVATVRRELKERSLAPSAEAWQKALNGDLRRLIKEGKQEEAKVYLLKRLGAEV